MNNFRRYNILTDEWVIVAKNRINRPWQGKKMEKKEEKVESGKNEKNQLAPGGVRSNGKVNEEYSSTFVFENDFPSFTEFETCAEEEVNDDLYKQEEVRGTCKVICYHPDSNLTLATMSLESIRKVVDLWNDLYLQLQSKYEWIQIFENRGDVVGCSNMHPHGQLWASNYLPTIPQKIMNSQKNFFTKHGEVMLMKYLKSEVEKGVRVVIRSQFWTVLVPFWAFWPYETMLLPNRHVKRFTDLSEEEKSDLPNILNQLLIKYDNIFECSFPYMMGWMSAPTGKYSKNQENDFEGWQLHCMFYPPLLRSATIPKFLAGYEVFAEKQRDITPENAAEKLRNLSVSHYSSRK